MLTTPDDPTVSLRELKHRHPRNSTVLHGHYRLHEDRVSMLLKREIDKPSSTNNRVRSHKRRDALRTEPSEQTFHLVCYVLKISHCKKANVFNKRIQ